MSHLEDGNNWKIFGNRAILETSSIARFFYFVKQEIKRSFAEQKISFQQSYSLFHIGAVENSVENAENLCLAQCLGSLPK